MKNIKLTLIFSLAFFALRAQNSNDHLWEYQYNDAYRSEASCILFYGDSTWIAGGQADVCRQELFVKAYENKDAHFEVNKLPYLYSGTVLYDMKKARNGDILVAGGYGVDADVTTWSGGYISRFTKDWERKWISLAHDSNTNILSSNTPFQIVAEGADGSIYASSSFDGSLISNGLFKFSAEGNKLWRKELDFGSFHDIVTLPDGNILIASSKGIMKVDSSGRVLWKNTTAAKEAVWEIQLMTDTTLAVLTRQALYLYDTSLTKKYASYIATGERLETMTGNDTSFYITAYTSTYLHVLRALDKNLSLRWQKGIKDMQVKEMALGNGRLVLAGIAGANKGQLFVKTYDINGNTSQSGGSTKLYATLKDVEMHPQNGHQNAFITLEAHITNTSDTDIDSLGVGAYVRNYDGCFMNLTTHARFTKDNVASYLKLHLKAGDSAIVTLPRLYVPYTDSMKMWVYTTGPNNKQDANIMDDDTVVYVYQTGIRDVLYTGLSIYPNPTHDRLYLQNTENLQASFSIYDLTGRAVAPAQRLAPGENSISLQALNKGIYILKLSDGRSERVEKIWKVE